MAVTAAPTPAQILVKLMAEAKRREDTEDHSHMMAFIQSKGYADLLSYETHSTDNDEQKIAFLRQCMKLLMAKEIAANAGASASPPATATKSTEELFQEVVSALASAPPKEGPTWHKRVAAHLRAVTGRTLALPIYRHDASIPEADKIATYQTVLKAIKARDWSLLQGEIGEGDKRVEEEAAPVSEEEPEPPRPTTTEPSVPLPARAVKPAETEPEPEPEAEEVDEIALIEAKLKALRAQKAKKPQMDEEAIKRIVEHTLGNGGFPTHRVEEVVDNRLSSAIVPRIDAMLAGKLSDFLKIGPSALAPSSKPAEAPLASAVPALDPTYTVSKEVDALLKFVWERAKTMPQNVYLVGPHGCGKSSMAPYMAAKFKMPMFVIDCQTIKDAKEFFGFKTFENGRVSWHRSQFSRCLEAGGHLVVIEEIPRTTDQIRNILLPLLDYRRQAWVEDLEDFVRVGPGTVIMTNGNEGMAYTGNSTLDLALDDRLAVRLEVNYLTVDQETKLIMARTGLDAGNAKKLAEIAETVRSKAISDAPTLTKTITTRQLLVAAEFYKGLGEDGLTYTLCNHFSAEGGENSERAQVLQMISLKFPAIKKK